MNVEKWLTLSALVLASCLVATCLYTLARQGRNLRRFGDRQHFWNDLYRFTVTIVCSLALYLVGTDLALLRALALPDGVLLFATTAGPTLLLCLLSGRWYIGYAAALLVESCILLHMQSSAPEALHRSLSALLLQNGLFDLTGLVLYAMTRSLTGQTQLAPRQARPVERAPEVQPFVLPKAGHEQ